MHCFCTALTFPGNRGSRPDLRSWIVRGSLMRDEAHPVVEFKVDVHHTEILSRAAAAPQRMMAYALCRQPPATHTPKHAHNSERSGGERRDGLVPPYMYHIFERYRRVFGPCCHRFS